MDKIKELKAEIFDIIAGQEQLKAQFEQLEKYKNEKLKELQAALEDQAKEAETIEVTND